VDEKPRGLKTDVAEIHYKSLNLYFEKLTVDAEGTGTTRPLSAPVYLIFGEEFLCRSVLEKLLGVLMPAGSKSLNIERIDGPNEDIREVRERVTTYSLLSETKIVVVANSGIFDSKRDTDHLINKSRQAFHDDDIKKAANYLLNLMGLLDLSYQDFSPENRSKTLKSKEYTSDDNPWLDAVLGYCMQQGLPVPASGDKQSALQSTIKKGFPPGNHLILLTDRVSKKQKLYTVINEHGVVIDCSIPKGNRRADIAVQKSALTDRLNAILSKNQISIEADAHKALYDLTGFDLRTFSQNVDKLVSYVGQRKRITLSDVEFVIKRTKKDPIYTFTNAITDQNTEDALFYLESLLFDSQQPLRPEQILVAITNQIRKLLLIRDFVDSSAGDGWYAGCSFGEFKKNVIPAIKKYDKKNEDQVKSWQEDLSTHTGDEGPKTPKRSSRKKSAVTELVIAKNPQNPYPIYLMFKKSDTFTADQLFRALESLNRADLRIKTSGQDKKLILEEAILKICR
jgi:DNA polymerase-3 subunit delta